MATKGIAMRKYDLLSNMDDLYELRPGWVIRLVPGEDPMMSHYRHPPVVMIAMMVAGTALQMYSQYQQGKQAEEIAEKNAAIMQQQAENNEARGDEAALQAQNAAALKKRQALTFAANQQKDMAAGNIRLGVGVSEVIQADTEEKAAAEIGYVMDDGYNKKRALYGEANTNRMQGDIFEAEGRNARRNSYWNMASIGLKGASSLGFMGSQMGMFSGGGSTATMGGGPNSAGDRANI